MTHDKNPSAAEYYQRFAKRLVMDIDLLLDDADFVQGGGRLLTATDSSEIYAYCVSASDMFLSRLGSKLMEEVGQLATLHELHEAIMLFYLFESDEPLWLLDPYLLELHGFLQKFSAHNFRETVKVLGDALRQIRIAKAKPEFAALSALATSVRASGKELTKSQQTEVYAFVEEVAPALVDLNSSRAGRPSDRLKLLLSGGRLVVPSDIPDEIQTGDEATFARWFAALSKRRPGMEAQNVSDAQSMATVFAINKWLLSSQRERLRKIVLLTRSETMHEIMRAEARADLWSETGGNVLRHPRGVLALLNEDAEIVSANLPERQIEVLNRWRATFAVVADSTGDAGTVPLTAEENVRRHLAVIADVWRRYCSAKAARVAADNRFFDVELSAISILVDPQKINRAARERLVRLETLLTSSHLVFGAMLSPEFERALASRREFTGAEEPEIDAQLESLAREEGEALINSAHGSPMPFSIRLSDARLMNVLTLEASDPFVAFSVLTQGNMIDRPDASRRVEREWYLALAYVFAAMGVWEAARKTCELATRLGGRTNIEVLLMMARAVRHLCEKTPDLIPYAEQLRNRRSLSGLDPTDALRLLPEELKYAFILARRAFDEGNKSLLEGQLAKLPADIAFAMKAAAQGSPFVRCEVHNHVLYHCTQLALVDRTIISWQELAGLQAVFEEDLKTTYGDDWRRWPDNFVDTAAWCRLELLKRGQLQDVDFDAERKKIWEPLVDLASREYVSNVDFQDFRRHAEDAKAHFEGANYRGY